MKCVGQHLIPISWCQINRRAKQTKKGGVCLEGCNKIGDNNCDDVIWQYEQFVDNVVKTNEMEFRNF